MVMVRLLPRAAVAVVPQAGELARRLHLKTRAVKALVGLPTTRVRTQTATVIVVGASLLPMSLPTTTLRAAAAVVAGTRGAALPVVLVALVVAAAGMATCLGTRSGRRLRLTK